MFKKKLANFKSSPNSSRAKRSVKKSLRTKEDIVCTPLKVPFSSSDPLEDYQPSAGLFEADNDIEGKELFQVTPLKPRKNVKEIESIGKSTPLNHKADSCSEKTPSEEKGNHRRSLRQKMKQELANLHSMSLQSDPEDSDENASWDEESDDDALSPKKVKGSYSKSFSETYFNAQKQKKATTSNRTLSSLKLQQTDIEHLQDILRKASIHHMKAKEAMTERYRSLFRKWTFLMKEGFNVLLYGVGSKRQLLNTFCKEALADEFYVCFNGFFPSLNIKSMLTTITEEVLSHEGKHSSLHDHTEFIKNYYANNDSKSLFVVIHNVDGMSLRSVKTQTILSTLAAVPNIHFICSIDHINSPLIWDQIMLSRLRWVWFDVTTFEPYVLETSYDNTILREQSSQLLLSSLLHVYRSLTPNGQGVFRILAQHQQRAGNSSGLTFHEWYQDCREAFLVNSEITMQAQLSEFKNHKLLTSRKSIEGIELWHIPVDAATLEQFLESCK